MELGSLAEHVGDALLASGRTVAVAESLTGGMLCSLLAAAPGAGDFFRGGVVAYHREVKYDVLGVEPGPVVSPAAARQMAIGARRLLVADVAVALTGAGGPDGQDGEPPGTVFAGIDLAGAGAEVHRFQLAGAPREICEGACARLLQLLAGRLDPALPPAAPL